MFQEEDLSFVADTLLALCEKTEFAPVLTESGLKYKERKDRIDGAEYAEFIARGRPDPLFRTECIEVFEIAQLTVRQHEVLIDRIEGFTFEQIGEPMGKTKQGVQRVFSQGLKKLLRAIRVYPFRGLADVYQSEVHRGRRLR